MDTITTPLFETSAYAVQRDALLAPFGLGPCDSVAVVTLDEIEYGEGSCEIEVFGFHIAAYLREYPHASLAHAVIGAALNTDNVSEWHRGLGQGVLVQVTAATSTCSVLDDLALLNEVISAEPTRVGEDEWDADALAWEREYADAEAPDEFWSW